jgi:uncharacterized protein YndB with AHSA1/START domain
MRYDPAKITIDAARTVEPVIMMSRMFDAPIEKVWACFTTPEHVEKWFGGEGFSNKVLEMDVRAGGLWKQVMRVPSGMEFPLEYVYVEVNRPTRLVWQNVDHGKRKGPPPTNQTAVTLEAQGNRTKWSMVATFSSIADRDIARNMGHAETVAEGCEKFNDLVKTL